MTVEQHNNAPQDDKRNSTQTGAYEAPGQLPEPAGSVITGAYRPDALPVRSGRYVLDRFHARGGMGEVWLAHDGELGRPVAVKRLREERKDQHERFLIEAQITGQLEHPGIVPVHDVGKDEQGQPFYVMKFVHGRTLRDAIDDYHGAGLPGGSEREFAQLRLLQILVQLCQTVAYAHSRGIVHRDLKPDNVMLGQYGETLVLDWGLSKLMGQAETAGDSAYVRVSSSGGSTDTRAGTVLGAPAYMPPEVAAGHAAEADQRTDVYLLGAILYQVLTGRPLRQGGSYAEMVEMARTVLPSPPRQVRADVPRALEGICLKAIARRKPDRYASALELAEDLQRYLAGEPVSAYRETVPARAWRWCRRHRTALGRSAAGLLLLGLGLFALAAYRRVGDLEKRAQARRDVAEFRRLADELRYYAASTDPADEHAPYYDPQKGDDLGRAALGVSDNWGPDLQQLAAVEERASVRQELYELLLLTAQARLQRFPHQQAAPEVLALLDRAAGLNEQPSASYHLLRALCLERLGRPEEAAEQKQRAQEPGTPVHALDHFLEGERCRTRAVREAPTWTQGPDWQPNRGPLLAAIAHYERALRAEPQHYWSYFQTGRCYLSLGQRAEAVTALSACVALRPQSPWGYSARGLALAALKRFPEAERDLNHALELDRDSGPARLNRAIVCWLQKKDDAALADCEGVLRLPDGKRLPEAGYYRGLVYLQRAQDRKAERETAAVAALKEFDRVVAEKPGFRAVYLARAQLQLLRGEGQAALDDLDLFLTSGRLKEVPGREAHEQRGRLLLELVARLPSEARRKPRALAQGELEKALAAGGEGVALWEALATVLDQQGQYDKALALYAKALEHTPESTRSRLLNKRGWAYLNVNQHSLARADFTASSRLEPADREARLLRAEAHTGLGYLDASAKAYASAQEHATRAVDGLRQPLDHYVLRHNLACIYAEMSRWDLDHRTEYQDLAITFLGEAVELAREHGALAGEKQLIEQETAFPPSLLERPDFKKLLHDAGS